MQNKIVLIVGFRGSGKSTVASSILRANNGVFLFDPHFDPAYSWIPNTARTIEQLEDYSRWRREAKPKRIGLRYIPDGHLDPFDGLNDFCAWAWGWRNIWLCVEEVSESTRSPKRGGYAPGASAYREPGAAQRHQSNLLRTAVRGSCTSTLSRC